MEFIFSVPRSNGFIFNTSTASIPLTVNTPGVSITEINDTIENGIYIRLGYKDPSWFTSNPTFILKSGEHVYNSADGTYKIGDGVTQLSSLSFYGGTSGGSQSLSQVLTVGDKMNSGQHILSQSGYNPITNADNFVGMEYSNPADNNGEISIQDTQNTFYHDAANEFTAPNNNINGNFYQTNGSSSVYSLPTVVGYEYTGPGSPGEFNTDGTRTAIRHDLKVDITATNTEISSILYQHISNGTSNTSIYSDGGYASISSNNNLSGQTNFIAVDDTQGVSIKSIDGLLSGGLDIYTTPQPITDGSIDNNLIITDTISNKGAVYANDYSANFTPESLVTKRWVTSFVGTASSATTVITSATLSVILVGLPKVNYSITALATASTIQTSGSATNFDMMLVRIKDNGTARALTFDSTYFEAKGMALPTTTVLGKVITIGFIFDSVTGKMGCVSVAQEI